MAYATISDMEGRLDASVLEKLTGASQAYNDQINAALDYASATVDSYAGSRFDLPLQTSTQVKHLVLDLAVWHLEKEKGTVREADQRAYDEVLRFLRDLASGRATLDQPSGASAQTASSEPKVTEKARVMSDANLEGF